MNRIFLIMCASAALAGCDPSPGTKAITDDPNNYGSATFLGTVDGCRLWSVNRGTFYFANCRSGVTSTGWTRMSGKTSRYYSASTDYEDRP